jgi:hypothetical protein
LKAARAHPGGRKSLIGTGPAVPPRRHSGHKKLKTFSAEYPGILLIYVAAITRFPLGDRVANVASDISCIRSRVNPYGIRDLLIGRTER